MPFCAWANHGPVGPGLRQMPGLPRTVRILVLDQPIQVLGGTTAVNQPAELLQFLKAENTPGATACDLPSWLP